LPSQGRGDGSVPNVTASLKIMLELMTSHVVTSEADVMYVVISGAEIHVPYGELVGTTEL